MKKRHILILCKNVFKQVMCVMIALAPAHTRHAKEEGRGKRETKFQEYFIYFYFFFLKKFKKLLEIYIFLTRHDTTRHFVASRVAFYGEKLILIGMKTLRLHLSHLRHVYKCLASFYIQKLCGNFANGFPKLCDNFETARNFWPNYAADLQMDYPNYAADLKRSELCGIFGRRWLSKAKNLPPLAFESLKFTQFMNMVLNK